MTEVVLADGRRAVIPTGPVGSWNWAREASWVSVAYEQAGDLAAALQWRREFERRAVAWRSIEDGKESAAIVAAGSWMDGPRAIYARAGETLDRLVTATEKLVDAIFDGLGDVAKTPGQWAAWVPWLAVGILAVVAVGFKTKGVRLSAGF